MSTTTAEQPTRTKRVAARAVQGLGVVWVLIAFTYFVQSRSVEPRLITIWLVVFVALGIAHIILSVRNRR